MSIAFDTASAIRRRSGRAPGLVNALELLALAGVPGVLCGVYALPTALRRSLVFEYGDPTVLTAVLAPFVHLDGTHLLVNVVGYAVVVPVAYGLSVVSGRRRQFWTVFGLFVVVFPPMLSLSNLAVPRTAYGLGFSGVVLAFVGYLPIGIADHLESAFDVGPRAAVAPATFFLGLGLVAALSLRALGPAETVAVVGTGGLAVVSLACSVAYGLTARRQPRRTQSGVSRRRGRADLLVVAGVVLLGMQFVAFPADPVRPTGVVNLYVHLLGYALGFAVVYATRRVAPRIEALASGRVG